MEKREPPKEEGAPAYMAQYTALMTILLAFFICMLTMGDEKAAQYQSQGIGYIKDAFGLKGGLGLLHYWKAIMRKFPETSETELDDENYLLGYEKGSFEAEQLDADGILSAELQDWGYSVRISTPIRFRPDVWMLDKETRRFLDRVGGVFYNLSGYMVTACCYETGSDDALDNQRIAARRAAAVAAYLEMRCGVPRGSINSVGYSTTRYLGNMEELDAGQGAVFFIRKTLNGAEI